MFRASPGYKYCCSVISPYSRPSCPFIRLTGVAEKETFAQSQQHLTGALGGANTIVVLTSSLMLAFAAPAIRRNERRNLAAPLAVDTIGVEHQAASQPQSPIAMAAMLKLNVKGPTLPTRR